MGKKTRFSEVYPTLSEVLSVLPKGLKKEGVEYWLTMYCTGKTWRVGYNDHNLSDSYTFLISFSDKKLKDALYKLLEWTEDGRNL